ncbi:MAG: diguanylate cyclase domain-containing protein [Lachnospiraceae bacterium]
MAKIWEFFENMNALVYVSDMENNDVIYMNKKALETYGLHNLDELAGRKCYELLHGSSNSCAICNNKDLETGTFKEWHYYNPLLDKHFELKDTLIEEDGRQYRMEIALDYTSVERQSSKLKKYENLEAIANEGFRLALQAPTPDKSIDILLEYLGKALKGERTYIFEKNARGGDDNTYEWVASGVTPEKDNLQNLPEEICANWYQKFSENRNIIIRDIEDIRESDPLQYGNLKPQNIHSLVVVPLFDEKKVIGFYGIDNPPVETLDYAQDMLEITGHFIISCFKRRELMKKLRLMSLSDPLTQFGNRFALNEYVGQMSQTDSVGIVYCDITGLKRINDSKGHDAGDRLIKDACESLKRVFGEYGLFRIGGDELLAICSKITEEELKERETALRQDMKMHAVTMAVGTVWKKDEKIDIDRLMSESEKKMYKDKAAYYAASGIDRRV